MKTNKIRYSRLVMATEYLSRLKNEGPDGKGPGDLVFTSSGGQGLQHPAIIRMIQRTVKRTTIKKRVYLHLFRKSRITHMIQQNYQESVIKQMMWGNLATNMFRTYAVLSNADIDEEVLYRNEIKEKQEVKSDILKVRQCPNCLKMNAPTDRYCPCGMALTLEAMNVQEAMKQTLMQDPEKVLVLIQELLGK
jgi:integrase/recombinase XerD